MRLIRFSTAIQRVIRSGHILSRTMTRILPALAAAALLGGCVPGHSLNIVDHAAFADMARNAGTPLKRHGIIDAQGKAWSAPDFLISDIPSGEELYQHLNPRFLYADRALEPVHPNPATFAGAAAEDGQARMKQHGFLMLKEGKVFDLRLAAVTQWDDRGGDDWLAVCTMSAGYRTTVWYLALMRTTENTFKTDVIGRRTLAFPVYSPEDIRKMFYGNVIEHDAGRGNVVDAPRKAPKTSSVRRIGG